jgi:hypothetical protein
VLLYAISPYSVVKQRLKCNTGKMFNCLIQFLLTMVLSIEERVYLVEYIFREGNRYTDLVHSDFPNAFVLTHSGGVFMSENLSIRLTFLM